MINDKTQLRKIYKAIRKSVENRSDKDEQIYNRLVNSDIYKSADNIMIYISMPDEADTKRLIHHAFADGKSVFVPKVIGNTEMKACRLTEESFFEKSALGVFEPKNPVFAEKSVMDLIVIPGLAFDINGVRLGFGGGFYDRYLSGGCCITAGLCYEECIADRLVKDEYDINVKYIITEKGIVHCGG